MKRQFISGLKPGDRISGAFVLSEMNLSVKKDGGTYLVLKLSDRTGRINGVMWENITEKILDINPGEIVLVTGTVGQYREALQAVVTSIKRAAEDEVDPAEFIPSSPYDPSMMSSRLEAIASTIENQKISEIIFLFLKDTDFMKKFRLAPAAKKMHHAYLGGLLEHTLSMASLADRVANHYRGVDRDLLIAGAILHDIGKIEEFEYLTRIDYSDEGRLVGHIAIGLRMLDEKISGLNSPDQKICMMLRHMIISHHGTREFGSPEPPKTLEAIMLHHIDELDSKIIGVRDYIEEDENRQAWTKYHRIHERHFYKKSAGMDRNTE